MISPYSGDLTLIPMSRDRSVEQFMLFVDLAMFVALRESRNGLFLIDLKDLCSEVENVSEGHAVFDSQQAPTAQDSDLEAPPGIEVPPIVEHADPRTSPRDDANGVRAGASQSKDADDYDDVPDEPSDHERRDGSDRREHHSFVISGRRDSSSVTPIGRNQATPGFQLLPNASGRWTTRRTHSGTPVRGSQFSGRGRVFIGESKGNPTGANQKSREGSQTSSTKRGNTKASQSKMPSCTTGNCSAGFSSYWTEGPQHHAGTTDCCDSRHDGPLGSQGSHLGKEAFGQNLRRSLRERCGVHQVGDRSIRCSPTRHERFGRLCSHPTGTRAANGSKPMMDSLFFVTSVEEQHWLNVVRNCQHDAGSQLDLLEIYADESSRLCEAVQELGGHARRFTIADGDLSTKRGRFLC